MVYVCFRRLKELHTAHFNVFGLGGIDLLCCCRASMDLLLLIDTQTHCCEHVRYVQACITPGVI